MNWWWWPIGFRVGHYLSNPSGRVMYHWVYWGWVTKNTCYSMGYSWGGTIGCWLAGAKSKTKCGLICVSVCICLSFDSFWIIKWTPFKFEVLFGSHNGSQRKKDLKFEDNQKLLLGFSMIFFIEATFFKRAWNI